ncbi:MAG: glycosyltransferase family 39 protein [Verrucomicrobiota bacterium]
MVKRAWIVLCLLIVGLTGFRLVFGAWAELIPEEAYYWTYSQHPSLGYFDHPPMVAWTIWLGTFVLGNTELGVRLVNIFLWIATAVAVLQTAKLWFDERVAVGAALLYAVLPVFIGIGFIVTPDGPLVFFWALCLYGLTRAMQEEKLRYWLLAGVALGGAMLSKYYAVVLVPSLLWFLLWSPKYRRCLKNWQLWLALVVGGLVFSPVIWWNSQNQWASFAFQSSRTVDQRGSVALYIGTFWVSQLAVLMPLGFALMVATAWRAVRRGWFGREDAWNFVGSFGLPVFGLFAAASFKTGVHVNWTAPAFLALAIGAAAIAVDGLASGNRWWRRGAWAMGVLSVLGIIGFHFGISGHAGKFGYSYAGGWRQLAASVEVVAQRVEKQTGQKPFFIGADKYYLAAELGFYLRQPDECVNMYAFGSRGLGYRYWTDLNKFEGRPALVVATNLKPSMLKEMKEHFVRSDEPEAIPVARSGKRWQNVRGMVGFGYRQAGPPVGDASLD